jgi:hypothetical protein
MTARNVDTLAIKRIKLGRIFWGKIVAIFTGTARR